MLVMFFMPRVVGAATSANGTGFRHNAAMLRTALIAGLAVGLVASGPALAQSYPAKPIRLVVPFAAGSATDSVARIVAQPLGERLKQPVVVDNRAGANGLIAADAVVKSAPDGYTLFMTTNTTHSAHPSLYKKLPYDPIRDFAPIGRTGELPFVLVVNTSVPARTLAELVAHARANPGKLSYGTPNSTSLVASETLRLQAKIDVVGVPYKSSPQALTDTIGGQLAMYVADFATALPSIRAGKVRALAVTPARRSKLLPDVPPMADTLAGFDLTSWNGLFAPAGTAKPVIDQIAREVQAILAQPEIVERLATLGFEVWPTRSPEEFARYVADQLALWTRLIKDAAIQPE
jgi:tripartite-type tricarboxylate transporter receptor subunit TctC